MDSPINNDISNGDSAKSRNLTKFIKYFLFSTDSKQLKSQPRSVCNIQFLLHFLELMNYGLGRTHLLIMLFEIYFFANHFNSFDQK